MIQVIASTYFAFRCFRYHGAKQARQIVRAFYQGEAFKIILVMIMMVVVFTCLTVKALPFFLTFIAVQLTSWLLPQFFNKV
jgi:ATP synthase protein I